MSYRYSDVLTVTPALAGAGAYLPGQCVGGLQTLAGLAVFNRTVPLLQTLTVVDRANQKAPLTLLFFGSDPTAVSPGPAAVADQQAFFWGTSGALGLLLGKFNVLTADYETINGKAVACYRFLNLVMKPVANNTLYAVALTTGAPTYAAAADLSLLYGFQQTY